MAEVTHDQLVTYAAATGWRRLLRRFRAPRKLDLVARAVVLDYRLRLALAERDQERAALRNLIAGVLSTDKTPLYGSSGYKRRDEDNAGRLAPKGQRWLTPAEMAERHQRGLTKRAEFAEIAAPDPDVALAPAEATGHE